MYVIMGATGNTGNAVAKQLLARGEKVRVIGRTADRLQPLTKLGAEPFIVDITDAGATASAFIGARAAYVMIRRMRAITMCSRTPSAFAMHWLRQLKNPESNTPWL